MAGIYPILCVSICFLSLPVFAIPSLVRSRGLIFNSILSAECTLSCYDAFQLARPSFAAQEKEGLGRWWHVIFFKKNAYLSMPHTKTIATSRYYSHHENKKIQTHRR
jgi:hypothetical protein